MDTRYPRDECASRHRRCARNAVLRRKLALSLLRRYPVQRKIRQINRLYPAKASDFDQAPLPFLFERRKEYGYVSMVPGRCSAGVFHAVRLRHGGNRLHPRQERRQHHHEKPDGLCHRYSALLASRLYQAAQLFTGRHQAPQ